MIDFTKLTNSGIMVVKMEERYVLFIIMKNTCLNFQV